MGRPRKEGSESLPVRMYHKHGAYYHAQKGEVKRTWIGRDYATALSRYIELEAIADVDAALKTMHWAKILFTRVKNSARVRRIPMELTIDDIFLLASKSNGKCTITGIKLELQKTAERNPWSPSIDRIDSKLGYTFGNVRLVCLSVNLALNAWGTDVLLRIAKAICEKRYCRQIS